MIKWLILVVILFIIFQNWVLVFFLMILGVILWVVLSTLFSVKLRLQTVNFYSGGLGSGKTLTATTTAINLYRRSKLLNLLTFGKIPVREIYSNYPIIINRKKKVFSKILKKEHILGIERLPEKVIVVIDEASTLFPNQNRKSDIEIINGIRWFRHWTDGTLILADQSIGDIDIAIRRRINIVYNFSSMRKYLNLCYKVDVSKINYMEDVVVNINDITSFKENTLFRFFGGRHYESRYMKKTYNPLTEIINSWDDLYIQPDKQN